MAVVNITEANFESEVTKSDKSVIIDFFAGWCGPCRMLAPVFHELSGEYDNLKFCKVDTEQEGALAGHFGVQGIPTLVIVNKGKEIGRIVGFAPKPMLKQKIDGILK